MKKGFTLIELLIVVAIIAILAAIAVPNFLEAQVRSKVSRVKSDQRSLATALESYYIDNNAYPATDSSVSGHSGINQGLNNTTGLLLNMPTFRRKNNAGDQLSTLSTPIAYITTIFADPFAKTFGASFSYSTPQGAVEVQNAGWIIWSYGPDVDQNDDQDGDGFGGDIGVSDLSPAAPLVAETFYSPANQVPSVTLLGATYDPTNGTTSSGDVWRIKQ